ncbi:MAG: DHA2 family efflux MFS transporter permease subunit [Lysobacterales bacterium]
MTTTPAIAGSAPLENRTLLVVAIMLATLMQVIDTTIANVALPNMQGSLSASQEQIAWVLTSYLVAAAVATPTTGWLATVFGRKRLLLIAIGGFTVASVLCATATTVSEIVIYRILQGLFGASLIPMSQSTLLDAYPREKHGSAMAMWGVGLMVGPILGPPLGGWLTEHLSWHWVFLINIPIGILAFLGVAAAVPAGEHQQRRFDMFGFVLVAIGIGALQMMLDRGQHNDWFGSMETWIEAVLTGLGLYLYWVHWRVKKHPFVNLGLLRDRNFAAANIFIFAVGIVLFATLALLPPYLGTLMNYPVVDIGLLLMPRGVGTLLSMMMVGVLLGRGTDPRLPILGGLILTVWSLYLMAHFTADMPSGPLVWSGVIQGLGLGFVFVPISTIAYSTLAPGERTEAAAMFSLTRNIGASVGISIVMTLLVRSTQINHAELVSRVTPFGNATFTSSAWNLHSTGGLVALNAEVSRQAAAIGYVNDFWFMMWMVLAVLPLLLLFKPVH